jgi:hypothetical protein
LCQRGKTVGSTVARMNGQPLRIEPSYEERIPAKLPL